MKPISKLFLAVGIIGFALFFIVWLIMMGLVKLAGNTQANEVLYYLAGALAFLAGFSRVAYDFSHSAKIAPDDVICMGFRGGKHLFSKWNSCAERKYQERFGEPSGKDAKLSTGWGKCHTRAPKDEGGRNIEKTKYDARR